MQHFSLNFGSRGSQQYWVFPKPKTNFYQNIGQLIVPQSSRIVKLDQVNQLMIAEANHAFSLKFL